AAGHAVEHELRRDRVAVEGREALDLERAQHAPRLGSLLRTREGRERDDAGGNQRARRHRQRPSAASTFATTSAAAHSLLTMPLRTRNSTTPSPALRPTNTCTGKPSSSLSLNFAPGLIGRSSRHTS